MKKTAILYIRVSTDEQADTGYSQRSQEELLKRYCSINSIDIKACYFEDHSAKSFERPEFKNILLLLKKHRGIADLLMFTKWDRFSRNAGDAYAMITTLNKLGVEPQAIEQPLDLTIPENKLMLAFFLAAPEVENDRRSLNVIAGMRRARKEGRFMGKAPIGYINQISVDGSRAIVPNPETAPLVRWIFEQVAEGKFTTEAIIKEVRKKGLNTVKNNIWFALRNPVYYGKIRIGAYKNEGEELLTGNHIPLVSEALFNRVQDVLDGNKRKRRPMMLVDEKFPLKGFLICPHCGKTLTASSSRGRKIYYSYYHCVSPCKARYNASLVNDAFVDELSRLKPNASIEPLYKMIVAEVCREKLIHKQGELKRMKDELNLEKERMAKLRELLLGDSIEADDYRIIKKESEQKVAKLEAGLKELKELSVESTEQMEKAFNLLNNIDIIFNKSDIIRKRRIIGSIFPEKLVFDGNGFRTGRVNEAVRLIFSIGAGFSEKKIGQDEKISILSKKVAPLVQSSNHFLVDLNKLLALAA